jgi:uncharacterized protein YbjT (DUF2867 family)
MTILITGASGNVGHNVMKLLMEKGEDIRLSSRNPESAGFPAGIETVTIDLTKPETLEPALKGIKQVFLYTKPDGVNEFVQEAVKAGVEKIVLLSSLSASFPPGEGQERNETNAFNANIHLTVENAIEGSNLTWCFLRPGAFATNSLNWTKPIKFQGKVSLPYPMAHSTPIHEMDIAEVAVKALTGNELDRTKLMMTGPESITQKQQIEAISKAIGKDIIIEEITPDEARTQMSKYISPQYIEMMLSYQAKAVNKPGTVYPEYEKIMGKPSRTFSQWANDHADDFK